MNLDYNKQDAIPKPISPTTVAALEYNQIAGSLMHTQNAAGLTADANDLTQITTAINKLGAAAGMPSTAYENISLGVSGTQYTAPANGYFVLYISAVNPAGYIYTENLSTHFRCETRTTLNGTAVWAFCPALKGEKVVFNYDAGGTVNFKFHYAEGSKSEA